MQSAATLSFEAKLWDEFQVWCAACLSDSLSVFSLCPVLAAMALRAYGNHCFAAGKTLSGFRHTIIAAQRRLLGCKPFLHLAWELVTRWETLEPPVHRCPVPETIVKAVAFLAHSWQLSRWAAVVLLAFYGLARVGEVLRCRRCDLLFPSDLLDECSDCMFLRFNESKTSTRRFSTLRSPTLQREPGYSGPSRTCPRVSCCGQALPPFTTAGICFSAASESPASSP